MNTTKQKAFTLIELLIVVSVIGVLTSVLISVINPSRSQGAARDGVRMANLEKLAQSIETYYAAEGVYPPMAELNNTNTPTTGDISGILDDYIKNWPEADPATYEYAYYPDYSNYSFVITVPSERGKPNSCLKYSSTTTKVEHCKECGDPAVAACDINYPL